MPIAVLFIDDNRDQFVIARKILSQESHDYLVEGADSAEEGLEKLRTGRFDLVLCDYRLPDVSGLEVLKALRQRGDERPFIIVTASGSERVAVEAMKWGADDYVVKDSSYDEKLPEVIRHALERSREKQERVRLEAQHDETMQALRQEQAQLKGMNDVMIRREERVLELKLEVNALLAELGRPQKYR